MWENCIQKMEIDLSDCKYIDQLVLVSGLTKDRTYELLNCSKHNISNFNPNSLQQSLDAGDDSDMCGLFDSTDKSNVLALIAIKRDYGPATYIHKLLGFQKGYGELALAAVKNQYGPIWLMASPKLVNDKFKPNTNLLDKFYRRMAWLSEFHLPNSNWNCPISFFYSNGVDKKQLENFCQSNFNCLQN